MEILQAKGMEELNKLMSRKQKEVGEMARLIAEREWELFEFNLFASSLGKEHLQKAVSDTAELKEMVREGKVDLEPFERLAEGF